MSGVSLKEPFQTTNVWRTDSVMEATVMKALGVISTTAMFLLLGATVPAFAQEEHHQESAKPAQREGQAKPAAKQEQAKPQRQRQQTKPAKQEQARPEKQQQQAKPQQEQRAKNQEQNQQKHSQQQAKSQEQNQQRNTQQQAKSQEQNQQKHENQHQQQVKTQKNEEKSQEHHQQQQANGHAQQSQGQYARNGQKDRYGHEYNESRFGPNHYSRFEENGGRYYHGRREYSYGGYWFYAGAYPAWFYQQNVYFILGADGLWYAVAYDNPSLTFQVNIG